MILALSPLLHGRVLSLTHRHLLMCSQPIIPGKIKNPAASARTDIRANYWSLLAGPSWRVNQYMSLYAMAGMGVAKVSADPEN